MGQNELGTPHGQGKLYFDDKNLSKLNGIEGVKSAFFGEFKKGYFKHGYLQYLDKSFYVGDFLRENNKFDGLGRLTFFEGVYY